MSDLDEMRENLGVLEKVGVFLGKAVDMSIKRVSLGRDPLDFDLAQMEKKQIASKAAELLSKGMKEMDNHCIGTAITYLKRSVDLAPDNPEAGISLLIALCNNPNGSDQVVKYLGSVKMPEGDLRRDEVEAVAAFTKGDAAGTAAKLKPFIDGSSRLVTFSGCFVAAKICMASDFTKAKTYLGWAIDTIPDNIEAHKLLRDCHAALGENDEAEVESRILNILD